MTGKGHLFIGTGDNTNPFESDGYIPIDERPGRGHWDAQGTSGNTQDLRGKILRILPESNGSYSIPEDNLFTDPADGRPEIYILGVRNPFRMGIDPERGWLYWGDVGPDAGLTTSERGSRGYDEFNQARSAGNYGWPYCVADNQPYADYDFQTRQSGDLFSCEAPVNTSPNNTGATTLPPAEAAWIWYPYAASEEFPQIPNGGGRTSMGGPVYYFDAQLMSDRKLPAYFDDTVFIYEWARNWILEVKLDEEGDILVINPFIPDIQLERPIAMELGPDGALYILEWGTGFGGNNNNSQLVRIDFVRGNRAPIASIDASPRSGPPPLTVQFSSEGSFDPDPGDAISYSWDFDGDGVEDSQASNPSFTYEETGGFSATLQLSDLADNTATASVPISVGNTPPIITLGSPVNGGFYTWGDLIPYSLSIVDAEEGSSDDGSIDCNSVILQPFVGHDDHSHPLDQFNACEGVFPVIDAHGSDGDNLFYLVEASYTDQGFGNAPGLTGTTRHVLHPKRLQAEHFTTNNGTLLEQTGDVLGGGQNVGFIEDGDHFSFSPINLTGIHFITYRVASAGPGGIIEIRLDAPDGPVISTTAVEPTGQWQLYREVTAFVDAPESTHELFFVFKNTPGASGLFNINWMDFIGPGIALHADEPQGLFAEYFANTDFTGTPQTRTDPKINFNWGTQAPRLTNNETQFSIRWRGIIEPEESGMYSLYAASDSQMNVWLDNQLLIRHRSLSGSAESASTPLFLEAGQSYALQVDYTHSNNGSAQTNLSWSSDAIDKTIIPPRVLSPNDMVSIQNEETPSKESLAPTLYPNPANKQATLSFSLPYAGHVLIDVFDVLGRKQLTWINKHMSEGLNTLTLDTDQLAGGTYFYVIQTRNESTHKSFTVIK